MINKDKPVVILGAGLAGLTAAHYLHSQGVPFRVFEAGKVISGLCQSEKDDEGYTYDCGAHFITNRLAATLGIAANCRPMPRYGETVYYQKRSYSYPFGLLRSARFLGSALLGRLTNIFGPRPVTATDHYRCKYGSQLADQIAIPLTEAWSGVPGNELSGAIVNKFATSIPWTFALKTAAWLTGRTVAIGYSGTVVESPAVWHVYPNGGISDVCEKLAENIQDAIEVNSPVEAILVENEAVVGVRVKGETIPAAAVISTAPVHILPKLVQGTDKLAYLSRFRYRAMVFVNLKIDGESHLPDVVTWVPEDEFPFFRVSDIGLGSPWLVPAGKSRVTCDVGCQVGDEVWNTPDADLVQQCTAGLEKMSPGVGSRILGSRVVRVPLAYPVYRTEYEQDRQKFEKSTGIAGLLSVGRNGEFAHILMEDVYWKTRWKLAEYLYPTRRIAA